MDSRERESRLGHTLGHYSSEQEGGNEKKKHGRKRETSGRKYVLPRKGGKMLLARVHRPASEEGGVSKRVIDPRLNRTRVLKNGGGLEKRDKKKPVPTATITGRADTKGEDRGAVDEQAPLGVWHRLEKVSTGVHNGGGVGKEDIFNQDTSRRKTLT